MANNSRILISAVVDGMRRICHNNNNNIYVGDTLLGLLLPASSNVVIVVFLSAFTTSWTRTQLSTYGWIESIDYIIIKQRTIKFM